MKNDEREKERKTQWCEGVGLDRCRLDEATESNVNTPGVGNHSGTNTDIDTSAGAGADTNLNSSSLKVDSSETECEYDFYWLGHSQANSQYP